MKKTILTVFGLMGLVSVQAQNAYDAERLTSTELNGTARFVGMGGALGALGGDLSVMGTNPAGIGIYRSNDFALSFGFNNTQTKGAFGRNHMQEDRTEGSFDQAGFVYSNKIGNRTSVRYVNFGFNYQKSKNFNRLFSMGGELNGLSQTWQLTQKMTNSGLGTPQAFDDILAQDNPYKANWNKFPVLGVMGVKTGLVDWPLEAEHLYGWDGYDNNFHSEESGGIYSYDFNISFNVQDKFYFGATLGVKDLKYRLSSSYTENLNDDEGGENGGYTLDNTYRLDGTGFDVKFGAIIRPIEDSPFRLGFAVHTPTWYSLTEGYNASLSTDILALPEKYNVTLGEYLPNDYLNYDYEFETPWKFNVSMGTTFSGLVALGAEYEYQDYSSAKFKDVDGYELGGQESVKENLDAVHVLRLGMETRLVPEFSIRAGYNYVTAAMKENAYAYLPVYGTRTDFNNIKERQTVTFGMGYRGSVIYADLAYKYDMYKSDFYAFDDVDLPKTEVDNNRHQVLFTLGARF